MDQDNSKRWVHQPKASAQLPQGQLADMMLNAESSSPPDPQSPHYSSSLASPSLASNSSATENDASQRRKDQRDKNHDDGGSTSPSKFQTFFSHQPTSPLQPSERLWAPVQHQKHQPVLSMPHDLSRSSSAPPVQLMQQNGWDFLNGPDPLPLMYKHREGQEQFSGAREDEASSALPSLNDQNRDPRMDPEYAAYYHMHSRLDPRLPPPLYAPGQSWQVWAPPGLTGKLNQPPSSLISSSQQSQKKYQTSIKSEDADFSQNDGTSRAPGGHTISSSAAFPPGFPAFSHHSNFPRTPSPTPPDSGNLSSLGNGEAKGPLHQGGMNNLLSTPPSSAKPVGVARLSQTAPRSSSSSDHTPIQRIIGTSALEATLDAEVSSLENPRFHSNQNQPESAWSRPPFPLSSFLENGDQAKSRSNELTSENVPPRAYSTPPLLFPSSGIKGSAGRTRAPFEALFPAEGAEDEGPQDLEWLRAAAQASLETLGLNETSSSVNTSKGNYQSSMAQDILGANTASSGISSRMPVSGMSAIDGETWGAFGMRDDNIPRPKSVGPQWSASARGGMLGMGSDVRRDDLDRIAQSEFEQLRGFPSTGNASDFYGQGGAPRPVSSLSSRTAPFGHQRQAPSSGGMNMLPSNDGGFIVGPTPISSSSHILRNDVHLERPFSAQARLTGSQTAPPGRNRALTPGAADDADLSELRIRGGNIVSGMGPSSIVNDESKHRRGQHQAHQLMNAGYQQHQRGNSSGVENTIGSSPSNLSHQQQSLSTTAAAVARSPILEDFRSNKTRKYDLADIAGHVVEFSSDQHGSRFIQQKLETADPTEKAEVFRELFPSALELMTDVFGNYVIQKFFEFGTPSQRQELAKQMMGHVLPLSMQMYGCRVVQKALEHVALDQQIEIIYELEGQVLRCVKDQNGNHVIQKAIERIQTHHIGFIISAFQGQIYALATHPYGCRVIQRIFEHCPDEDTAPLLDELHRFAMNLIQDQYGNYVIQHVLERGHPKDRDLILDKVKGQIMTLSKHKFASNVVEKCVAHGSKVDRQALIDEVVTMRSDGIIPLIVMMKDQFANYVIQKMLDVVDPEQRAMLIEKIRPHLSSLRKFTYGKHLITKVEKILSQSGYK